MTRGGDRAAAVIAALLTAVGDAAAGPAGPDSTAGAPPMVAPAPHDLLAVCEAAPFTECFATWRPTPPSEPPADAPVAVPGPGGAAAAPARGPASPDPPAPPMADPPAPPDPADALPPGFGPEELALYQRLIAKIEELGLADQVRFGIRPDLLARELFERATAGDGEDEKKPPDDRSGGG